MTVTIARMKAWNRVQKMAAERKAREKLFNAVMPILLKRQAMALTIRKESKVANV